MSLKGIKDTFQGTFSMSLLIVCLAGPWSVLMLASILERDVDMFVRAVGMFSSYVVFLNTASVLRDKHPIVHATIPLLLKLITTTFGYLEATATACVLLMIVRGPELCELALVATDILLLIGRKKSVSTR